MFGLLNLPTLWCRVHDVTCNTLCMLHFCYNSRTIPFAAVRSSCSQEVVPQTSVPASDHHLCRSPVTEKRLTVLAKRVGFSRLSHRERKFSTTRRSSTQIRASVTNIWKFSLCWRAVSMGVESSLEEKQKNIYVTKNPQEIFLLIYSCLSLSSVFLRISCCIFFTAHILQL